SGSGHVMRCLALASTLAEGGWQIGFAANAETYRSVAALSGSRIHCIMLPDAATEEPATLRRQWPRGADILVVDHYGRDTGFEHACRGWARRVVAMDDLSDRCHDADVLIDPGAESAACYNGLVPPRCRVLVGPKYAIVSPDFRLARQAALARHDGRPV